MFALREFQQSALTEHFFRFSSRIVVREISSRYVTFRNTCRSARLREAQAVLLVPRTGIEPVLP
jgi:hypothetical protein